MLSLSLLLLSVQQPGDVITQGGAQPALATLPEFAGECCLPQPAVRCGEG